MELYYVTGWSDNPTDCAYVEAESESLAIEELADELRLRRFSSESMPPKAGWKSGRMTSPVIIFFLAGSPACTEVI